MKQKIHLKVDAFFPRIDHYLNQELKNVSRSQIEKLIKNGKIALNQQIIRKKNHKLYPGDEILIELEQPEPEHIAPTKQLVKLFEDPHILIIDKPSGIAVHPGSGKREETILDVFRYNYPEINTFSDTRRPGIVHRLDKDTSGLLILAKDEISMKRLQKQFKRHEIKKTYIALVSGIPKLPHTRIDLPIIRNKKHRTRFRVDRKKERPDARRAVTEFEIMIAFKAFSMVRIYPLSGRTHQIRVHLASHGHPILGDTVYSRQRPSNFPRLALHAYCLEFSHPITQQQIISYSHPPEVFRSFMAHHLSK